MDYKEIDSKWQKAWQDAGIFESDVNGKESYLVTVAFPYVNAPLHIGHVRTYGTADVLARYKRMRGFNVLFPMAFHATGTPILAFAKRLRNGDKELVSELKLFHIADQEIAQMTDPKYIASYFVREIETGMHRAGLSVDWRRKFVSTDPFFSKFVEWQFGILNSKGYIVKGKHPVGWCPNENQAVGMHDTKKDAEPDIEKETTIKFKVEGEDAYFICTTFRPETAFGVTNLFVNRDSDYIACKINGEGTYYISKQAAANLKYQLNIEQIGEELKGYELLDKKCRNPLTDTIIPILNGFFVKEGFGTGVVMSVPAHAPFDYMALKKNRVAGVATEIKPIVVLEIPEKEPLTEGIVAGIPAEKYIRMFETEGSEDGTLEKATKQQYKDESHYGRMIIEGYKGMSEPEAREKISKELVESKKAFELYILANAPVKCRCGYDVVVKVVDDQWFLNYGNPEWKALAKEAFAGINVLPEKLRKTFEAAIDWIDLRAVARAQGLGTPFPLEKEKIIESLSDSTIYMSFYTVSNMLRDVEIEKLKPELFDYVFLGKGELGAVAESTGIDFQVVKRCKESFDYWYRNMSRHSGADLIFNHLTMYIFNHAAVFGKANWPKQIVVNGNVLSEGEKMSKSIGNIVPLVDGVERYGTDVIRTLVIASADLFSDSEFSEVAARGVDERFRYLYEIASKIDAMESRELGHMDYWMYSKLNRKIKTATSQVERLELRGMSTGVIYDSVLELKKYLSRGEPNGIVVRDYISNVVLMMSPIAPHVSEELWHLMGNTTLASVEKWPTPDESMISDKVEGEEELLESIIADSKQITALMTKSGKKAKAIKLIVADDWKRKMLNELCKSKNVGDLMGRLNAENGTAEFGLDASGKEKAVKYAQQLAKKVNALRSVSSTQEDEYRLLDESKGYLSSMLGCPVTVEVESKSTSQRSANAAPLRPSIDISS